MEHAMHSIRLRFVRALKENNIKVLIRLAKGRLKNTFINERDAQHRHILHVVAQIGTPEQFEELLKTDRNVLGMLNLPNSQGNTPLHEASRSGNLKVAQKIIQYGAQLAKANLQGDTPLHVAAKHDEGLIAEEICLAGFSQNRQPINSDVPPLLRPPKFDPLAKNNKGKTAIQCVPKEGWSDIENILAKHNANRHFEMGLALIYQGKPQSLKKHIEAHPSVLEQADKQGDTLLHHAFYAYKQTGNSCILTLLRQKRNINAVNKLGQTPFLLAAALGIFEVETANSKYLLVVYMKDNGVNIMARDLKGYTALHFAALNNKHEAIRQLSLATKDIDPVTLDGLTPLHVAIMHNQIDAFNTLNELGANVYADAYPKALQNLFRQPFNTDQALSPLWFAFNAGHVDIVNSLFDLFVIENRYEHLTNLRSLDGSNLLHFFAYQNDFKRFKKACDVGVPAFEKNNEQYTAFHVACIVGNRQIVKHFLKVLAPNQSYLSQVQYGAFDINDQTKDGQTGLLLAHKNEHTAIEYYLRENGAVRLRNTTRKRSITRKTVDFVKDQWQYSAQMESTNTYQWLSIGRVVASTLMSYGSGLGMFVQAGHQLLFHKMPVIKHYAQDAYYYIKPTLHNYAPRFVEYSFDFTVAVTSNFTSGAMATVNILDIAANPVRRMAAFTSGLTLANAASLITDNQNAQAIAYFTGRELGMFVVEAYQQNDKSNSNDYDVELYRAMDLWRSLLGPSQGEYFVNTMHYFTQLHQSLLQNVGWFEHTALASVGNGIDSITNLFPQNAYFYQLVACLQSGISQILPEQVSQLSPQVVLANLQYYSRQALQLREQALKEIERLLTEKLVPESEYKNYALSFLNSNKLSLLNQSLDEAQKAEQQCEVILKTLQEERAVLSANENANLVILDREIEAAQLRLGNAKLATEQCTQLVTECQQAFEAAWQKTPKGAKEGAYNTSLKSYLTSRTEVEALTLELEFFKDLNNSTIDIQDIEQKLTIAQEKLQTSQNEMGSAQDEWLSVMSSPERKYHLDHQEETKTNIEKAVDEFRTEKRLMLTNFKEYQDQYGSLVDIRIALNNFELSYLQAHSQQNEILLRIQAIDSPPPFIASQIVDNALDQYPRDGAKVIELILNDFVATGTISAQDASEQIGASLSGAWNSHSHKRTELIRVVTNHWNAIKTDYRNNLLLQHQQLKNIENEALEQFQEAQQDFNSQQMIAQQALESYLACLTPEDQARLSQETSSNLMLTRPYNWDYQNYSEDIKLTLTLVGQPELALGSIIFSGCASSVHHQAAYIAKWLIDYKYLFLQSPSLDVRLQEVDALAASLKAQPITPQTIADTKQNIDAEIAQKLLVGVVNPENAAQSILNTLESGFRYKTEQDIQFNIDSEPLSQIIIDKLSVNDEAGAIDAITQVLNEQTQAFSINEAGVYVAPIIEKNIPEKPHGLKRFWQHVKDEAKHYANKLTQATGGFSMGASRDGISAGFTNGNQFQVVRFNAKPQNVLNLPIRKPLDLDVTTSPALGSSTINLGVPFPARVPKEPLPRVLPPMMWEVTQQSEPLIFSQQAQAAALATQVQTRSQTRAQSQQMTSVQNQSLTVKDFEQILTHKEVPLSKPLIERGIHFATMFFRAIQDPNDPEVLTWQAQQREKAPNGNEFISTMSQFNPTQIQYVFKGMGEALTELGAFTGAEIFRITHGEETIIGQTISEAYDFLSDRDKVMSATQVVSQFVRDEYGRLVRNEPTLTNEAFDGWLDKIGQMSSEQLLTLGGKELMYAFLGESALRAAGIGASSARTLLNDNINMDFFAQYGIRTPIDFRFEFDSLLSSNTQVIFNRILTSDSLNKLAKPVDQHLISQMEKKGWTIVVAKPGSEDYRYLTQIGCDASINTAVLKHIVIKEGAPKSALLEEFLHGTQLSLGMLMKYKNPQVLEVHVKDFMLRHVKLLGIDNPHDIRLLKQLKIEEIERLNKVTIR
jgi:ankyrin repeat protein